MDLRLSAAGLLVGILVGATGMGGGSLMTPLLVLAFGFNPTVAVGTDLFHGAIFKSVGALRHRRLGTVQARLSGWMLLGSGPTSIAGVWLSTYLKHRYGGGASSIQMLILGVALVAGGIGTLLKSVIRFRERPDTPFVMVRRDKLAAFTIGLFGGFIVGLTSVGSGVFFGLTLLIVFPLRSSKIVGTDILHAAALLWIAGVGHLVAGNVDLAAVGALLLGSVPGVLIGSGLTVKLPDRSLRLALGTVLVLSGVKLVKLPYDNDVLLACIGVALVLAIGVPIRRRVRVPVPAVLRAIAHRRTSAAKGAPPAVRWHRLDVDKRSRADIKGQRPCVLWLTGLSGAGKSTIANLVDRRLHDLGYHTYILDGDNVRHGLNRDLGFGAADRVENIRRVAEVARLMVDAGLIVIVAFISPFRSDRDLARALFGRDEFIEVYVDAPLAVVEARDTKGLYKRARAGEIHDFTGIDSPYEPPEHPELHLETSLVSPDDALEDVLAALETRGFLGARLEARYE